MDAHGELILPLDLAQLFKQAYDAGARISNNSYGAPTGSIYYISSMEIDDFVSRHRDMLIVRSAGNDGIANEPKNSQKGFVDWLSMGSPGTCKNGLTVGASRSSRKMELRKNPLGRGCQNVEWEMKLSFHFLTLLSLMKEFQGILRVWRHLAAGGQLMTIA